MYELQNLEDGSFYGCLECASALGEGGSEGQSGGCCRSVPDVTSTRPKAGDLGDR